MSSTGSFPTTHWSQVARGRRRRAACGTAGGNWKTCCAQYLPRISGAHVIRVLRVSTTDADDLVQGFICDRIVAEGIDQRAAIRPADDLPHYLLTALDRHVARVRRYDRAKKRRPDSLPQSLDEGADAEHAAAPTPSEIFDIAWAAICRAGNRQIRKECISSGRPDIWGVFEARVLSPMLDGTEPTPYPQLVESLRLVSGDVAANLTVTGKRMFGRCLRAVVGQYLATDTETEQEIADLREILAGGRK